MKTRFRTNVDCCKGLVNNLNDGGALKESSPLKGDNIVLFSSPNRVIQLMVVERTWIPLDDGILEVELNLNSIWSEMGYKQFEEFVENRYRF